jgi:hypothetical protein
VIARVQTLTEGVARFADQPALRRALPSIVLVAVSYTHLTLPTTPYV